MQWLYTPVFISIGSDVEKPDPALTVSALSARIILMDPPSDIQRGRRLMKF